MKLKIVFPIFIVCFVFVASAFFLQAGMANAQTEIPSAGGGDSIPPAGTANNPSPTQDQSNKTLPTLENPLKAKNVTELLYTAVDLAIFIGIIIAVLMFIYIGFKFVMAQGNSSKLAEARQWFLWAVIGTAILISAKVIVSVIQNTLSSAGVTILNNK